MPSWRHLTFAVAAGLSSVMVAACAKDGGRSAPESKAPGASTAPDAAVGVDAGRHDRKDVEPGPGVLLPKLDIHFIGRFDTRNPIGPMFSWPGTRIRTRFSGTGATIKLQEIPYGAGHDQLDVSIDGAPPTVLTTTTGTATYLLASGLPDREHDVVVTKRTEALVGTLQLLAIESTEGRPLVPTPVAPKHFIEFVGDSITCGYGVLGNSPCSFTPETESEPLAYGGLTASMLGVEHAAISWSGIGVYRDFGGSTVNQMPALFLRSLAADPTSSWDFSYTPDVVVVNLGTNDFAHSNPGAPYQEAMTKFTELLRSKYASAHIVLTVSSMMVSQRTNVRTALAEVIAQRVKDGDTKITLFEFDEQVEADGYGCDAHPNQTTQRKSAEKLSAYLRDLTGW